MDKHCETCHCGRRARVQGDHRSATNPKPKGPGHIAWAEYLEAYSDYARRYGTSQSAERLVERGGLSYWEVTDHLGHPPKTWIAGDIPKAPVEPPAAGAVDLEAIEAALTVADRKTDIFDAAWAALGRLRVHLSKRAK